MDLTIYDIIQGTITTEKSVALFREKRQMMLKVHPKANKPLIKKAVEALLEVKVEAVRVIVRKGKVKTFKRIKSVGPLSKRALVTLKAGYSLPAMEPSLQVPQSSGEKE